MSQNESYCLWPWYSLSLSLSLFPISHTLTHTSHALQVSYFYIMAFSTSPLHRMDYPRRWETGNSENSHTFTMYDSPCAIQIYSTHTNKHTQHTVLMSLCICSQPTQTSLCMGGKRSILHSFISWQRSYLVCTYYSWIHESWHDCKMHDILFLCHYRVWRCKIAALTPAETDACIRTSALHGQNLVE